MKSRMFLEDRGSVDLLVHIEDMDYIAKCHGRIHRLEVALARLLYAQPNASQATIDQALAALGKPVEDLL